MSGNGAGGGVAEQAVIERDEAVLRTLSPALRQLEQHVRAWLDGTHRFPLSIVARAGLEGMVNDLRRKADDLEVDRPLLVIVLMGGTGVGKSTLLNALAGDVAIAQASFQRPTTRDPVVYYHESVRPDRLDPALRHCRLAPHDRPSLQHKVIVDTPDLDSNDLANREKLQRILPVADIVLYVGSQEKYHDRLGWDLFLQQRRRRAFAFVLNKWDRCLHAFSSGIRPDEDLLRDLKGEGFEQPVLFRTCAQLWVDHAKAQPERGSEPPSGLPEGEQFRDLMHWLELGLSRLEIEAIKSRGVGQLLQAVLTALSQAAPPDLSVAAQKTKGNWEHLLRAEAGSIAEILLLTLEPYQREIEHHFALQGQQRFRGIMAGYLQFYMKFKYMGSSLRNRIPLMSRPAEASTVAPVWDLSTFTQSATSNAANRSLDARVKALANRLLVEADTQQFPVQLLNEAVEQATQSDWRGRHSQSMMTSLTRVEQEWVVAPSGGQKLMQSLLILAANTFPLAALLGSCVLLLWRITMVEEYQFTLFSILMPLVVLLVVLIILQILIGVLLPMRWSAIRERFQQVLTTEVEAQLCETFAPIPQNVEQLLADERRRVLALQQEVEEVASWLAQRENASTITGLYGG